MQQHLGRQDGVAKVEVKLLDGTVTVTPREDGRLDPASILKATNDSGVTVAEMEVTARGRLVESEQGLLFQVSPNLSFPLVPNAAAEKLKPLAGREVTLRGRLYKKTARKGKEPAEPLKLEVLEVVKKE